MPDKFTKETRSRIMSSIRGKNTKPEIAVRKILWHNGVRYRIHDRSIFGTPDISIKKKKIAVFIDGCFWHGCSRCYKEPKTNIMFWRTKISKNKERRIKVKSVLVNDGWNVIEIWEHQIYEEDEKMINNILNSYIHKTPQITLNNRL